MSVQGIGKNTDCLRIVTVITGLCLLALSVPLIMGKGAGLVAGYNTASEQEKAKYNEKLMCRIIGVFLIIIAVLTALLGFVISKVFVWIYLIITLVGSAIVIILVNTVCKKNKRK